MDNYRPTRPTSLNFNRWKLEIMYPNIEKHLNNIVFKRKALDQKEIFDKDFISSFIIDRSSDFKGLSNGTNNNSSEVSSKLEKFEYECR